LAVRSSKSKPAFKNFPITTINNGIDLNFFRPHDKKTAREKLSLPPDKKIILYGADFADPEKDLNVCARPSKI